MENKEQTHQTSPFPKREGPVVGQLIDEGKQLWQLVGKYAKLEAVERLTFVLTIFILGGILFALGSIALYCACMYFVTILHTAIDSLALSYAVVGLTLVAIAAAIVYFRDKLIVRPLVRSLVKEFFAKQQNADSQQNSGDNSTKDLTNADDDGL